MEAMVEHQVEGSLDHHQMYAQGADGIRVNVLVHSVIDGHVYAARHAESFRVRAEHVTSVGSTYATVEPHRVLRHQDMVGGDQAEYQGTDLEVFPAKDPAPGQVEVSQVEAQVAAQEVATRVDPLHQEYVLYVSGIHANVV